MPRQWRDGFEVNLSHVHASQQTGFEAMVGSEPR